MSTYSQPESRSSFESPFPVVTPQTRATVVVPVRDPFVRYVVLVASIVAVLGFFAFYSQGNTLAYYDASARMMITRRIVDSPTPGLAHLGSVWPPLTHMLALPLVALGGDLYRTGIPGSLVSMAAFVLTAYYLYKLTVLLTKDRGCGLVAAFVFMFNLNLLYMQATPMTEVPMIAAVAAAMYYLTLLSYSPDNRRWLVLSGLSLALGSLIRYENWIITVAAAALLLYVLLRKRASLRKIEGVLVFWSYWAFAGIALWLIWNIMIFGSPLAFIKGDYANSSIWALANDPNVGNWKNAFLTYFFAGFISLGPVILIGVVGMMIYVWRTRLASWSLVPFLPLSLFVFFVYSLYGAQRPMQVPQISGSMYNIRFALILVLPAAIFTAYLAKGAKWRKPVIMLAIAGCSLLTVVAYGTVITIEPSFWQKSTNAQNQNAAIAWLKQNYDGGMVLSESFGNEFIHFDSPIPLRNIIYEGSYRLWDAAQQHPEQAVEWVIMRVGDAKLRNVIGLDAKEQPDKLGITFQDSPTFHAHFERKFQHANIEIYKRRSDKMVQR